MKSSEVILSKIKIAFLGTPDFSLPTLEILHHHPLVEIMAVITMPARPSGRGQQLQNPPVAEFALKHKIPLFQSENINRDEELFNQLKTMKLDLLLVLAFAQFLGQRYLDLSRLGAFNIHTSLLPKYRGAAPIQYALKNNDSSTGVSIQRMVKKMDAGDLCFNSPQEIFSYDHLPQLTTALKFNAALATRNWLDQIIKGNLNYTSQNEESISFAPVISKEEGLFDLEKLHQMNLEEFQHLVHLWRAFFPWPGITLILPKKKLKLIHLKMITQENLHLLKELVQKNQNYFSNKESSQIGWIYSDKKLFLVKLYQGNISAIECCSLQWEGKKVVHAQDFISPYPALQKQQALMLEHS